MLPSKSIRRTLVIACLLSGTAGVSIGAAQPQSASRAPARGCIVNGRAAPCTPAGLPEVRNSPPAPKPEPVAVAELPLPPSVVADTPGSCSPAINPRGTGCILGDDNGIFEGPSYMWDGKHVLMPVEFAGAPAAPNPASIYSSHQVIAIKTDGTKFPNGDAWKCLTCGIPEANRQGSNMGRGRGAGWIGGGPRPPGQGPQAANAEPPHLIVDHPQAFRDGTRMIAGANIVDCGAHRLTDAACTPDKIRIFPMFLQNTADGSGPSAGMREIRLHPDDVHIGFGTSSTATFGRLAFNPSPKTGTPLVPRWEVINAVLMTSNGFFGKDPNNPGQLVFNRPRGAIGEFRGWSSDGKWAFGNYWEESGNVDIYKTSLATGQSVRVSRDPGYTDPMKASPDDKWNVVLDVRDPNRHMWYAGMRGIPPLTDLIASSTMLFGWRNANFRYFSPILLDAYGERGNYHGQSLSSDPNWNARADPAWSPDGTRVVYWEAMISAPACSGLNQKPCPVSNASGGRRTRLMMAHLLSRKPQPLKRVAPVSDKLDWGRPRVPGPRQAVQSSASLAGKYILKGAIAGSAEVEIREGAQGGINYVSARYSGYSDDGFHFIDGTERVERMGGGGGAGAFGAPMVWHSDLKASGLQNGTKVTSEGGFRPGGRGQPSQGSLTTTIDGRVWTAPSAGN